jgi:hypothetical protein
LTREVEERARAAGKSAGGDASVTLSIQELLLANGREFVKAHASDKLRS